MSMAGALALSLALLNAHAEREALGIWSAWGAFRTRSPLHCWAVAEPVGPRGSARPFASIARWPAEGGGGQLHLRLSRVRAARARVTLSIGERRFDLVAGAQDAWAPDARTDQAVVAAIRDGRSMSVESVAATGQPFADTYALKGAATAIDAAALGCIRR
jgi:hypothetical protein